MAYILRQAQDERESEHRDGWVRENQNERVSEHREEQVSET